MQESCGSYKKGQGCWLKTTSAEESDLTSLVVSHVHTSIYGACCCLVLKCIYFKLYIAQSSVL